VAATTVANPNATSSTKSKVVATFFPVYDFARTVGGDRIDLSLLVPPGTEVHDWEPSPEALRQVAAAQIVLFNGANLEPWIPALREAIGAERPLFVDTSAGLVLLPLEEGGADPHIWLDPLNAKHQIARIRNALVDVDPPNRNFYEINAERYLAQLDALDAEIRTTLGRCAHREFVAFHEAFSYFAARYGLTQLYLLGGGQEEPSPEDLLRVIEAAKARGIQVVYAEPLQDPRLGELVAAQIPGGRVLVLDPIEEMPQEDIRAGRNYLSTMQQNLDSLVEGLECRPP
jgi:zinc transport system substrate-binding protein